MEREWKPQILEIHSYKETGTFIVKIMDEITQLLDDHIVMTQSMSFSPYKKAFEERIATWEEKLVMTQDVLDEWIVCQRSWLYLEPIFRCDFFFLFLLVFFLNFYPEELVLNSSGVIWGTEEKKHF